MGFDFHPDAKQELDDAVAYYDKISRGMGDALITEVENSIKRIEQFPEAWPQLSQNTRRCRIVSFPYGIVYSIKDNSILIIAFMHLQRRPDYWVDRV
jgi:mRNA-degrading endonuclease RelE of RelBE toxin-antitoxin system